MIILSAHQCNRNGNHQCPDGVRMKTLTEGTAVAPFPKTFGVKRARAERSNASSANRSRSYTEYTKSITN